MKLNRKPTESETATEGDDGNRKKRQDETQERRQPVGYPVGLERHDILFHDELYAVGQRLQQSMRAHQVGSPAPLNVGYDLAFQPRQIGNGGQQENQDKRDFNSRDDEENRCLRKCAHVVSWLRPLRLVPNYNGSRSPM